MAQTFLDDRQVVNRAALAAIGSATNATLDSVFGDINTLFANATSAATASVIMKRDTNANTQVNNLIENFTTTATAAGTTTLTVASTYFQQFTGTNTQTVVLPNATTLIIGQSFFITNRSTGYVTVNANGGGLVQSMAPGSQAIITVVTIGTSAGTWDSAYSIAGSIPFLLTNVITDSTTTGSAATLQAGDIVDGVVRLTNASLVSVSGIPAGTAGQHIAIENQTGNTFTINNNDAGATAANRIFTGTGGAIQMAANSSFEFIYDATVSRWMLVGGTGSGSGSGGSENYLSVYTASTASGVPNTGNGNFELGSTSGWSLAHSALSSSAPTSVASAGSAFSSSSGGTAASGNLSLSVVSSAQLAGSYSGSLVSSAASTTGDLLISSAFFIDLEDKAKMMQVKFYYENVSGTFNNSGTSSNTFAVWIYDVTNGAWIQPQGVYNLVQGSGTGYCTATFQTTSNSTQYQLALININATAGAYTMYVDDLSVGPQIAPTGPAMTDWQPYTVTIRGTGGTNPTKGGVGTDKGFWRRVGDSVEILYQYQQSTGGADGTGNYVFSLPNGIMIDTTKLDNANAGLIQDQIGCSWSGFDGSNTWQGNTAPASDGAANGFSLFGNIGIGSGGSVSSISSSYYAGTNLLGLGLTQVKYAVSCRFPIVGWSSNTSMSSDTDTRVVAMQVQQASPTATITSSPSLVKFTSGVSQDTHGGFSTSTGGYTIPVSGYYRITFALVLAFTGVTNDFMEVGIGVNSTTTYSYKTYAPSVASWTTQQAINVATGYFTAGTVVYPLADCSDTSPTISASPLANYFMVERLSGPAVIAATESVNGRYFAATATITSSFSTITYSTKDFDTHNAYSSGTLTIPVSGKYQLNAGLHVSATFGAAGDVGIAIFKNGTQINQGDSEPSTSATTDTGVSVSDVVSCLSGDLITVKISCNAASPTVAASNFRNFFSWSRVGN